MSEFIKDLGTRPVGKAGTKTRYYLMLCDCGSEYETAAKNVKAGKSNYCKGCRDEKVEHDCLGSYQAMMSRCNCSSHIAYENYGGRGIKVCAEWHSNKKAFIEWATSNGWEKGLTIERDDNDLGYNPDNCRWIPKSEQNLNQRVRKDNTTGAVGVHPNHGKYEASYRGKYLGLHDTIDEAKIARDNYIKKVA